MREPRTRGALDLHGPPPVRQPGYLREARGFASPPRDGFAVVDRSRSGIDVDRWHQPTAGMRAGREANLGEKSAVPPPGNGAGPGARPARDGPLGRGTP